MPPVGTLDPRGIDLTGSKLTEAVEAGNLLPFTTYCYAGCL